MHIILFCFRLRLTPKHYLRTRVSRLAMIGKDQSRYVELEYVLVSHAPILSRWMIYWVMLRALYVLTSHCRGRLSVAIRGKNFHTISIHFVSLHEIRQRIDLCLGDNKYRAAKQDLTEYWLIDYDQPRSWIMYVIWPQCINRNRHNEARLAITVTLVSLSMLLYQSPSDLQLPLRNNSRG